MGKRKSKVNKQKQIKAIQFGVGAVKKGKHGVMRVLPTTTTNAAMNTTTTNNNNNNNNKPTIQQTTNKWTIQTNKTKSKDLFDQEMKSLVERTWRKRTQDNIMKTNKKKKNMQQQQMITLAPPTLQWHPKTSNQLLEETTRHVQIMSGIGQQLQQEEATSSHTPMAILNHQSWTIPKSTATSSLGKNPYAVLEEENDSDNGHCKPGIKRFQLAPPSFQMPYSIHHHDNASGDIDPDL